MKYVSLEQIKRLAIAALVSDDFLMGVLVLKGGNALNIAYDLHNRGSIDIDFSIEKDFNPSEIIDLQGRLDNILNIEYNKAGYKVFDVKFEEKPNKIDERVKDFWGGYLLSFKLIEQDKFDHLNGVLESIRRNALVVGKNNSTNYKIDISKYEYVGEKKKIDMEGSILHVYSPEMLVIEKLRAICQQNIKYKDIIYSHKQNPRSRDFYDIYILSDHFAIEFKKPENIDLIKTIFDAKRVPLYFIGEIEDNRELHIQEWDSVMQTVNSDIELKAFDFYFAFVIKTFKDLV